MDSSQWLCVLQVLNAYDSTVDGIPAGEAYEHSELILYKAMVLTEGGKLSEALELLHTKRVRVTRVASGVVL